MQVITMEVFMMRRFSLCLVSLSVISLFFVDCLQAQEIPNQDVPKIRGVQTPPAQRPLAALSPQEIFKRASPSVMVVQSLDVKGTVTAFGSGVVIAPGQVVTNHHVIEVGVSFKVKQGSQTWIARLVKVDPNHDLAELSVDGLTAPAVRVRDSSTLAVGEKVHAIGSPQGLELTISEGLISGLRDFDKGRVIQSSATISHGSSGGGLFDAEGQLVGITTFFLKEGQSLNFALPGEWTLALDRQPATATPSTSENSPAFQALLWLEIGWEAVQAGKYEQSLSAFQEAIRLKPDYAKAWYNLGYAYNRLGQYDKAISAFQEAIRLKPDFIDAWVNLGNAYNRLEQYDKAISAFQEAIRLKPDFIGAWVNLGNTYNSLEQYDKAISAYREAIRLKPDDALAWANLGRPYYSLGQYDKAISAFQEAIRLKPDDALAWANLGITYDNLRQYDKAISALQEAIRLKPDDALAWANLGNSYKHNGQRSDVIKVYEKLKTLDPKMAEEFFQRVVGVDAPPQRATMMAREGYRLSPEEAKKLESELKKDPENLDFRTKLLGYYFSNANRLPNPAEAIEARRRHILWVIEHHPEAPVAESSEMTLDPTGHKLADKEGYEQAKKLWLEQIDHRKDDVQVLVHAARFFRLTDKLLALTCLKKALQLAPQDGAVASRLGYTYAISALGITMINNNGLPMAADPVEASGELAKTAINELRASSNPVVIAVAGSILSQYGSMIQAITKSAINQDALAEELLTRAEALDPKNPGPPNSLSQFYFLRMLRAGSPEERTTLSRKRLVQAEMAVDRTTAIPEAHLYALITASEAAIDVGAFDKARRFATDLLKQVADPQDRRYGQAFHDGHVVLGRVALKAGDMEQAKSHLLQAGHTPGGGTLSSFGPNMALAKELLEKGEKQVVIQYLEECKKFWSSNRGQLDQWITTINAGGVPQFGGNLIY
jgi:tetratricopeptide (TPR) repeat protein